MTSKPDTTSYPRPIVRTSANPVIHCIIPELAEEIGLNESIFLMQIAYWISGTSGEFHDGKWWTYQSARDMAKKVFKYWSHSTINRIARKLINAG